MMHVFLEFSVFLIVFFAVIYIAMTFLFLYGWLKIPLFKTENNNINTTSVSIVIAARNEEKNLKRCLDAVSAQEYPEQLLEIIVVDDSSDDNTFKICKDFINEKNLENIKLIPLGEYKKFSKKEAVKCGVELAKGDLIVTTDADCTMGKWWLKSIVNYYEKTHYKLICAPVTYNKSKGLFQQFQLLDFLSMIVSGAGAIGVQKSFIGNAANMTFEKKEYLMVLSNQYDSDYASGDDVFLMHKIKEKFKKGIGFLKNEDSIVYSEAKKSLKELIKQRMRWASKSKGFRDVDALTFASVVFGFNFIIVLALLEGLFKPSFFYVYFSLLIVKCLTDAPLIYGISSFNKRKDLLLHYLWIQCIYPFYIVITAIMTFFKKEYQWKGRRYH